VSRPIEQVQRVVRLAVALVLAADAILLGLVWVNAAEHPEAQQKNLQRLREENRRLGADVRRAEVIRTQIPSVEKDCDVFLRSTLLVASSGYSAIVADLEKIAKEAGIPPGGVSSKQKAPDKQGMIEVEVSATVEGQYSSLIKFINGLERSKNLYLLDAMSFNSGREHGGARLSLVMRTFFRS